jgi:hypothetical protein
MEWQAPWFIELDLDAGIGVYEPDTDDDDDQDRLDFAELIRQPSADARA